MAITLEEEAACDPRLSAKEANEMLLQCQTLPDKKYYDPDFQWVEFGRKHDLALPFRWGIGDDYRFRAEPISLSDKLSNIRKSLREKFLKWFLDSDRDCSLFWITDPFLVREIPTVGQSFAGILQGVWRLGEVVFCEYPMRRDDLSNAILTIVRQLAEKYPPFRRLVLKELVDSFMVRRKSARTLFERLIVRPWDTLACTHPFYLKHPPVVIVTLQQNAREVSDFMELISEYGGIRRRFSLLWLVFSHPSLHHLKSLSSTFDKGSPAYEYHTLSLNDAEAKEDVCRILHEGFQDIRTQYSHLFSGDEMWPTGDQVSHFTTFISGDYILASTILRFIGAEGKNPKRQLQDCVACTVGSPAPLLHKPLVRHRHFLQQLLVKTAPDAVPLLITSIYPMGGSTIGVITNLLGLSRSEYHHAIEGIRCFLVAPLDDDAFGKRLEFCDHGFKYFCYESLLHPWDPPGFSLTPARLQILKRSFHILGCPRVSILLETMSWRSSTPFNDFSTITDLLRVYAYHLNYLPLLVEDWDHSSYLRSFDFRCLVGKRIYGDDMNNLICLLKTNPMFRGFVRTKPLTALDQQFIDKCKMVAIPTNFKNVFSKMNAVVEYVLVGHGDQTVLVLLTWDLEFADGGRSLTILPNTEVTIYSPDMLDDI